MVILFAGPSLPATTSLPSPIVLRPPARCGDLLAALAERPAAIGLVDGLFETAPSVWHKEILYALEQGVPVYGAGSLGALRAAELAPFGMRGVGAVFAAYRNGLIERDDAVMVAHAPAELGHRALTIALVDAEAAIAACMLPPSDRRRLIGLARGMPFRTRTWTAILDRFAAATGETRAAEAARQIATHAFSQKERDTALLVQTLAEPLPPMIVRPRTPMTPRFCALLDRRGPIRASDQRAGAPG